MSFLRQTRVLPLTHLAFNALNIDDENFLEKAEKESSLQLLFTILPSNYIWAGIPEKFSNESCLYRKVIDKAVEESKEETNTDNRKLEVNEYRSVLEGKVNSTEVSELRISFFKKLVTNTKAAYNEVFPPRINETYALFPNLKEVLLNLTNDEFGNIFNEKNIKKICETCSFYIIQTIFEDEDVRRRIPLEIPLERLHEIFNNILVYANYYITNLALQFMKEKLSTEQIVSILAITDKNSITSLMKAADNAESLNALLQFIKNLNLSPEQIVSVLNITNHGDTALMIAANNAESLNVLLQFMKEKLSPEQIVDILKIADNDGYAALMIAAYNGESLNVLLQFMKEKLSPEQIVSILKIADENPITAFMKAAYNGESLNVLLQFMKENLSPEQIVS